MLRPAAWRKLALALPETAEKSHFGQPDFRVRGKIFAGLSEDETLGTLKLSPEIQSLVVEAKPETFFPATGAWGRSGWTRVHLATSEAGEIRSLLLEAWRLIAPKTLVAAQSGLASQRHARRSGGPDVARRGRSPTSNGKVARHNGGTGEGNR